MPEPVRRVREQEEETDRGMDGGEEGGSVWFLSLARRPGPLKGFNYAYDRNLGGDNATQRWLRRCDRSQRRQLMRLVSACSRGALQSHAAV